MDYVVQTRQQLWGDFEQKWAEATGTSVMPHGVNNVTPEKSKTVIQKTASVDPRVDVHGKEPDVQHIRKVAQHYAMPKVQRYPLDSFSDVEKAADTAALSASRSVAVSARQFLGCREGRGLLR